jgi:polyisoprenyl-phosphate glycosyltransferase
LKETTLGSIGCYISAVSPVYLGGDMVEELVNRLSRALSQISDRYEIVLVEDGSPDDSWERIVELASQNPRVKGIRLSRNFGQHYAITAGLRRARGDWVVVLDCDLQDQPEEIPALHAVATAQDYDLVFARRQARQDNLFRRFSSKCFYTIFSFLTDTHQDSSVANFGVYSRDVVNAVLSMGDHIRYFPTMSQWVGFRRGYKDVEHSKRATGTSSYSFLKLLKLAGSNALAFSNKPLALTVALGAVISGASLVIAVYFFVQYLLGNVVVLGYTSLILSIWFVGGMVVSLLGVVGLYVGYTFEKVKGRPTYIVSKQLNLND